MATTGKRAEGRSLRALTMTIVLTLLATLLLAGVALAVAKPGQPTAETPNPASTVTTSKPTFKWSKATGAAKYELRVYQGSKEKLSKPGLTKLTWKSSAPLPTNVTLTWKVRASNASGAGAWSRSLKFQIVPPGPAIGDHYQGGIIAYIVQPGDPGYVAGQTHGLIAATADQTASDPDVDGVNWSTQPYWGISVPGTGTDLGSGSANTNAIIAQNGAGTTYAAGLARAYTGGGYSDWYLPSKDELNQLYLSRAAIGGFDTTSWPYYWSSSEHDPNNAWSQYFFDGYQLGTNIKGGGANVRAVRSF